MAHLTSDELESGLDHIRAAPDDRGTVELIVRRPAVGEREVVDTAELSTTDGLVGDTWNQRSSRSTADGSPDPDKQVTLMNARAIDLLATGRDEWPLAGDQLYVDLDLSDEANPPGTRLSIGSAVVEITAPPHNGCAKFAARFGQDAMRFVNSPEGRSLHLRGVNARVVAPGTIAVGDIVSKV